MVKTEAATSVSAAENSDSFGESLDRFDPVVRQAHIQLLAQDAVNNLARCPRRSDELIMRAVHLIGGLDVTHNDSAEYWFSEYQKWQARAQSAEERASHFQQELLRVLAINEFGSWFTRRWSKVWGS